jgi:hypothetical protein
MSQANERYVQSIQQKVDSGEYTLDEMREYLELREESNLIFPPQPDDTQWIAAYKEVLRRNEK